MERDTTDLKMFAPTLRFFLLSLLPLSPSSPLLSSPLILLFHLSSHFSSFPSFFQFGNTCYCNSVLQSLYFCKPFRYCVQKYNPVKPTDETILTSLSELYKRIASQKKKTGMIAPRKFIAKLRKENGEEICSFFFFLFFFFVVQCSSSPLSGFRAFPGIHSTGCP